MLAPMNVLSLWWHLLIAVIKCDFSLRRTLFWWKIIYLPVYSLSNLSGYPKALQATYLEFLIKYIFPLAGPSPSEFTDTKPISYMGDDNTPIEFSWVLNSNGKHTVRFTMEPLSSRTGVPSPSDTWIGCLENILHHSHVHTFDISWAKTCFSTLVYTGDMFKFPLPHYSQFSIGADLTHDQGIIGKAYFLPHIRSAATGLSQLDLVSECVRQLGLQGQWDLITTYVSKGGPHLAAVPEIVAVDCIPADLNRLKIYFRSNVSTLREVIDFFTLGDTLQDPAVVQAVQLIRRLWELLFPDADEDTKIESTNPNHYASRIPIYFELAAGRKFPYPKLYIPVRHYCKNDESIARAITQYYKESGMEGFGETYIEGIQSAFNYSAKLKKSGLHAYLGIAARKNKPQMSTYLSPLAFSS